MRPEDEEELLHVDHHQWVRRQPSKGLRLLWLALALVAVATAIYLSVQLF